MGSHMETRPRRGIYTSLLAAAHPMSVLFTVVIILFFHAQKSSGKNSKEYQLNDVQLQKQF